MPPTLGHPGAAKLAFSIFSDTIGRAVHPDGDATLRSRLRRLPDLLTLRWAGRFGEWPGGEVITNPLAALTLRECLRSHAAHLVPFIVGGGLARDGFHYHQVVRHAATGPGPGLYPVRSQVAVDLATGSWSTDRGERGADLFELAQWAWSPPGGTASPAEIEARLLAHLGLATLDLLTRPDVRIMQDAVSTLRARRVNARRGKRTHTLVWCPWCECTHEHGLVPGRRSAHCGVHPAPFACTGYTFTVEGTARGPDDLIPDAPAARERRNLRETLTQASDEMRKTVLRHLLGVKRAGEITTAHIAGHRVEVSDGEAWEIAPPPAKGRPGPGQTPLRHGEGFTRLAAALFGVTPGIAAAHMLKAVSRDDFDGQAMADIAAAVDAWAARQAKLEGEDDAG